MSKQRASKTKSPKAKEPVLRLYSVQHYHRFGNCNFPFVSRKLTKDLPGVATIMEELFLEADYEADREDEWLELHEDGPISELPEV